MDMWLMDAYRKGDSIVLWIKTKAESIRIERSFSMSFFSAPAAEAYLRRKNISFSHAKKMDYLGRVLDVLEIPIPELSCFESFIRRIEQGTRYRVPFYNADIKPEQMFFYENNLRPCGAVRLGDDLAVKESGPGYGHSGDSVCKYTVMVHKAREAYEPEISALPEKHPVPLRSLELSVEKKDGRVHRMVVLGDMIFGDERDVLERFASMFTGLDPDVIFMDYAYSMMPFLYARLRKHGIACPLHRWDDTEIKYRGGRSYWSYGQVRYQDYAVRLHGRFLVDKNSFVGTECDAEGIAEMAFLSGTLYQQTASRSFGAVFQTALVREMIRKDILVPYKEKPNDKPLNMIQVLKCDRGGHTFDPIVGFHKDVAEIDFTSMFPWLIYNHNISADTILSKQGPFADVPNVPIRTSLATRGLIPTALKPFIDRRMHYKKNPSAINKRRAAGLKWVLVSCYGYLRFREFKLGIPTSHMAICALSRETLLNVINFAQQKGYEVVHGIVDSLYIKKDGMTEEEVRKFCRQITLMTGIPMNFEGIFKWIVFLPSVVDSNRPLPATYYGAFSHGGIKARGIEVRQRSVPVLVKLFQENVLEHMAGFSEEKEIVASFPLLFRYLRKLIKGIGSLDPKYLVVAIRVSRADYRHNIPQKIIVEKLKKRGVRVEPGQFIRFIYSEEGVCLPEEYCRKPDVEQYTKLLVRSLFIILQPFGVSKEKVEREVMVERQAIIQDFMAEILEKTALETQPQLADLLPDAYTKSARL